MNAISKEENKILNQVRKNFRQLMTRHGITVSNFCKYIENEKELSFDRSTFLRFMNGTINKINLAFLVSCCRVFELSLDNLVSDNFNPDENYLGFDKKFKDIPKENCNFTPFNHSYPTNEIFIVDPNSPLLEKYIQTYYCYYYSTVSDENHTDNIQESLISGTLDIEPDNEKCKATLKINTKELDEEGNPLCKTYSGYVVLCPSIQSLHCSFFLPNGEFCFIIFRYSHLNHNKQECRLAEVLSTSSIPDKRYPIVHRMLLSNEQIKDEDLAIIAPHLCLNTTDILISEAELLTLANKADDYNFIAQEIFDINDSELMYRIKEDTIKEISKKCLASEELPMFITELRSHSLAKRYNKVSPKADELVRETLFQKGYFQKKVLNKGYEKGSVDKPIYS